MIKAVIGSFTIHAWAERVEAGWFAMASVHPSLPNTWHGGPSRDSLVTYDVEFSEELAEEKALSEARAALLNYLASRPN